MKIEELLPSYSHLNKIFSEAEQMSFSLDAMKEINAFYACYSDMAQVERSIILLILDKRLDILLQRLKQEAQSNLCFFSRNRLYYEHIASCHHLDIVDLEAVKLQIDEHTNKVNEVYDELKDLNNKLDWPVSYSKDEVIVLERRYEKVKSEHDAMSKVLSGLYAEERQIKKILSTFTNTLPKVKSLDEDIIALVDKYHPEQIERTSSSQQQVSSDIHDEGAPVEAMHPEMCTESTTLNNDKPKGNRPRGRSVDPFERLLNGSNLRKEKTRKKLQELIKGKKSKKIALVITCAMDSTLMTKPTYRQLVAEYVPEGANPTGVIGSENSIIQQIGKCHHAPVDYAAMMKNFDELRMMT